MRLFALTLAMASLPLVQADILHLRDGSRQHGELILQNDQVVMFRVYLADGVSSMVRTYRADEVAQIERTGRRDLQPDAGVDQGTALEQPAEDHLQMLREGFELIDDGDLKSALRAVQRAVRRVPEEARTSLEAYCRQTRGVALDQLLARLRICVAAEVGHDGAFRLTHATQYERQALGQVLESYQVWLLARVHDGRSVGDWAAARDEYADLRPGARGLVADARRAAAVLGARLRFDPRLQEEREPRREARLLRSELTRLAAHVLSLRGYTSSEQQSEAEAAARPGHDSLPPQLFSLRSAVDLTSTGPLPPPQGARGPAGEPPR